MAETARKTEQTRECMRRFMDRWAGGDMGFIDFYADDCVVTYHNNGNRFESRDALLKFYTELSGRTDSTKMKIEVKSVLVDGDMAAVRSHVLSSRTDGEYDSQYVHIYTWRDGKISKMEAFPFHHVT